MAFLFASMKEAPFS